jgi:hypothetical protein
MDTDVFMQLLEMVKEVSPAVWAMARRQVTIDIISAGAWFIITAVGAYVCLRAGKHYWASYQESLTRTSYGNSHDLGGYLGYVFGAILALVAGGCLNYFLGMLANPDYTTLLKLVRLFMHGA